MMNYPEIPYEIARRYLNDNADKLEACVRDKIHGWIRARRLPELASVADLVDPALHGADQCRILRQIGAFFKKNALYADKELCDASAKSSFIDAEVACAYTNLRLDSLCDQPLSGDLALWVSRAEKYIFDVLGGIEPFLEELPELVRLTPGATRSISRKRSVPPLKLKRTMDCTPGAKPYLEALCNYWGYSGSVKFQCVSDNRIEVVPKNWKTSRTIACEPTGNVPLQLAFDSYAKKRLLPRGINLFDQSRNQELAWQGSVDGSLSTIDMSAASDTVAFNTVALLFPLEWFQYLNAVRCTHGSGIFGDFKYQKFSSMGNGSTFAIETLIFAAMAYAIDPKGVFSVYGDDIVIETRNYAGYVAFAQFLGFKVNQEKSFESGPFRESCGKDWWAGNDVTPFYIRDWRQSKARTSHNINGLARIARPYGELWEYLKSLISEAKLPLVPYSDDTLTGVHVDPSTAHSSGLFNWKRGIRNKTFAQYYRAYVAVPDESPLVADSRALFLWYQSRRPRPVRLKASVNGIRLESFELYPVENSGWVLQDSVRYKRKWVAWFVPSAPPSGHMHMWSSYITADAVM